MTGTASTARRERIAAALLALHKRVLSPLLNVFAATQCKYLPTCSEYAYVAVVRHGWLRGGWLAATSRGPLPPLRPRGSRPSPLARMLRSIDPIAAFTIYH